MKYGLGKYLHTFTVLGACKKTGQLGIGFATYSLGVGGYCPVLKPNLGVVSSQAYANPRLGILAMKLLGLGFSPEKVLKEIEEQDHYFSYRQIGIVNRSGIAVCHTGPDTRKWAGHHVGEGYVSMGNALSGQHVVEAIAQGFESSDGESLDERLLRSLEAGRDVGGQANADGKHLTERSAALIVCDLDDIPYIELRVDAHETAVDELRRIHGLYAPYVEYVRLRSNDPPNTPAQDQWAKDKGLNWSD